MWESICIGIQGRWADWHGLSVAAKVLAWFGRGIPLALENAGYHDIITITITLNHDGGGNNRKALKDRAEMGASVQPAGED